MSQSRRGKGVSRRRWLQGLGMGAADCLTHKLHAWKGQSGSEFRRSESARTKEPSAGLPGTHLLIAVGDPSVEMRAGIDRFLDGELARSISTRQELWHRDLSSPTAYDKSVEPNRERFRAAIGLVDPRIPITALEYRHSTDAPARVTEEAGFTVYAVSWPVLEGVSAEGLLLEPKGKPAARIVVVPDADQIPEMLAGLAPGVPPPARIGLTLARHGCCVLIPTLIDRNDTWSGNPDVWMTNEPHREWICRQAYALGRHIIGYEIQKVLAAIDWFKKEAPDGKVGVAGHGEGGLIALYAGAVDARIDVTLVSGYFASRRQLWEEPLYRNVFGLLHEFGDAEIAGLIAPRKLIVEHSQGPQVEGPPAPGPGRHATAAPGILRSPEYSSVSREVRRASQLVPETGAFAGWIKLASGRGGSPTGPGSSEAIAFLLSGLGVSPRPLATRQALLQDARRSFQPEDRQRRQLRELEAYTQKLAHEAQGCIANGSTADKFWQKIQPRSFGEWKAATEAYREYYRHEIIGRFTGRRVPLDPKSRKAVETASWTGYEVTLNVLPEVFTWAYLLVPKELRTHERRPLVVCQHGADGIPPDTFNEDPNSEAFPVYKAFAARLVEEGFVVCAPHIVFRGGNDFRRLQRKCQSLKKTLWAITVAQHQKLLDWLATLPFVDSQRMGFYGLSYGGATAMYVPPLVDRYAVVICSANFTELVRKTVTIDNPYGVIFYDMHEWGEFNIGNRFGYAQLAALIAPRPFMVERGHQDPVSPDEWVAYEYARVQRLYDALGIPECTRIEYFHGGHTIHGVGTFEFLHEWLDWKRP